jgi:hypothetical protein
VSSGPALETLPEFFVDALPALSWTIDCVFIDETWAKTNMVRTHRWGPRGQRLRGEAPHGHGQTLTFSAALRHERIAP